MHNAQYGFSDETGHPVEGNAAISPRWRFYVAIVLAGGLAARIYQAYSYFLDPDEALHTLLASYGSAVLTFQATLTTAHPPLLIFLLHYWRWLGQSEFVLRLPSILAGTLSCWLICLWLRKVTDDSTAFVGLLLCTFCPALIELSAQVRQYAILNLFIAACLYCSERAVQDDSPVFMHLFSLSLCGAVLTHYSAFLFAFSMGVYLLVRMRPWNERFGVVASWAIGQIVVAAVCAFFLLVHIPRLKQAGMPQGIAETWLRKSIYHAEDTSLLLFPARQTLRVFTYIFSHGLLGTLALLIFIAGYVLLLKRKHMGNQRPSPRELSLLIGLPFVLNCGLAIAGKYPYGGTRHDVYLAFFAIAGIAVGLSWWRPKAAAWKIGVLALALTVCNLFPAPPPLIRASNHRKALMADAVALLKNSAPPGSILFTDYQSGLLLGYYLCHQGVVQVFVPLEPFAMKNCGDYAIIAPSPQQWQFEAGELTPALHEATQRFPVVPGTAVWLVEAGWMPKKPAEVTTELSNLGCKPRYFGSNIRFCAITIGNNLER